MPKRTQREGAEAPGGTNRPAASQLAGRSGSWDWDIAEDSVTWSPELYWMFGLDPDAGPITYDRYLAAIHPDDRALVQTTIQTAVANRQPYVFQHRIVRPDKSVRTLYCQGLVIVDAAGNPAHVAGTTQDVTETVTDQGVSRWLDALALRRKLAETFERVTDAFVALDREWRYTYVNQYAGLIFGREPASLIGKRIWDEFPEGVGQPFHLAYERAVAEQVPMQIEAYYPPWDKWFENRIYPSPEGLSIFFTDVTERRRLEGELRESADRFRDLTEHIDEVVYIAGTDPTDVTYVSPAFERIWGFTPAEMQADPYRLVQSLHPDDREAAVAHFTTDRARGWDFEYRILRPDGSMRWVRDRGTPVADAEGRFVRVVGVAEDITERRLAEEERARVFRQLEVVVQQMPESVILAEAPSGRIVLWNQRFVDLFAHSPTDRPIESIADYTHFAGFHVETGARYAPEDWPLARAILHGETVMGEEIDMLLAGGARGTIRVNAAPVRDAEHRIVAAVAVVDDVTEQHHAARVVRAQEQALELVATGAPLSEVLDLMTRLAEEQAGQVWASIFLLEDAGRTLRLAAAPSFPESLQQEAARIPVAEGHGACAVVARQRRPVVSENIAADPDWTELRELALRYGVIACWSAPIFASDGELLGTFAMYSHHARRPTRHETQLVEAMAHLAGVAVERRRAEDEIRTSHERFQLVSRATSDVVYDYDIPSGRLTWNDTLFDAFRYPPGEPAGTIEWWETRLHPEDRERVLAGMRHALEDGGQTWSAEYRFRRGDGTYATVHDRSIVTRDEQGRALRMLGSMQDMSERVDLEAQLRQAQKMEAVGQLAGGVAHDFNNILTAIRCSAEFLLAGLPSDDPLRDDVVEIQAAADRAASLTRQLLAFSRRQVVQPQVFELNAAVVETEKMLRRVIGEDVTLTTHLSERAGRVRMDRGQLQQVLLNLAINARDAMPEGGVLAIDTGSAELAPQPGRRASDSASGLHARLSVRDSGIGMDEATRARVFEPFFTTKPVGKGTGLGLSTVYGIVRQAGGRITVQSEVGRGTTFEIFLPVVDGASADSGSGTASGTGRGGGRGSGAAQPRAGAPAGGAGTVLLAEDDRSVRTVVRRVLQAHGYTVLEAKDGREALRLLERHGDEVRLVVSDVVMPEMGGRELVDRLAVERPGLRLLLMSGYTQGAVARRENLPPNVAFLEKPFVVEELLETIRRLMAPVDSPAG